MDQPDSPGSKVTVTRGDWLKAAGAVSAGLALAGCQKSDSGPPSPAAAPAEQAPPPEPPVSPVNVAIIGTGKQGGVLIDQAVKLPGIHFKAVCDIWPYSQKLVLNSLRRYSDLKFYTDYREMLAAEKGLDAVIVATPDWMHAEHSIACMKAGLHVYCEKEMSNDLSKARQMVQVSRETKKLLQIGHQRRSNPLYVQSKTKLVDEAKLLGHITHIYGQWNRAAPASAPRGFPKEYPLDDATLKKYGYDTMDRFRDWRWYKQYGAGPIADLGSHQIDIFGWFLGAQPKSVLASGGLDYFTGLGWEWPDNVMAIYEFDTPQGVVRAYYQVLCTTGARSYYETFMGTGGTLQVSEQVTRSRLYPVENRPPDEPSRPEETLPTFNPQSWQTWVDKGYILRMDDAEKVNLEKMSAEAVRLYGEYRAPTLTAFIPNVDPGQGLHQAHLQNFFEAVRGNSKLNCPGEVGYETAVQVLKVNEAIAAARPLNFKQEDFTI